MGQCTLLTIIVSAILSAAFVTSLFLCVFLLYIPTAENTVKADCAVTKCDVYEERCSRRTCTTGGTTHAQTCTTTYYTCWEVAMTFQLSFDGNVYSRNDKERYQIHGDAISYCEEHGIGSSLTCYYDKRDPANSLAQSAAGTNAGGIAAVVVFSIASATALTVLIAMIVKWVLSEFFKKRQIYIY